MTKEQKKIYFISGSTLLLGIIATAVYRSAKNRENSVALPYRKNNVALPVNSGFRNWKGGNTYLTKYPKGIRNNNPGNLVHSPIKWQGKIPKPNNAGRFEMFISPEYGVRAMIKDLTSKIIKYKTIEKIVSRYAPAFENNTSAYINTVAKALNVSPNTYLQPTKKNLKQLVMAMSKVETGGNYISNELFEKAYKII